MAADRTDHAAIVHPVGLLGAEIERSPGRADNDTLATVRARVFTCRIALTDGGTPVAGRRSGVLLFSALQFGNDLSHVVRFAENKYIGISPAAQRIRSANCDRPTDRSTDR